MAVGSRRRDSGFELLADYSDFRCVSSDRLVSDLEERLSFDTYLTHLTHPAHLTN
jgi:hypothetical protein